MDLFWSFLWRVKEKKLSGISLFLWFFFSTYTLQLVWGALARGSHLSMMGRRLWERLGWDQVALIMSMNSLLGMWIHTLRNMHCALVIGTRLIAVCRGFRNSSNGNQKYMHIQRGPWFKWWYIVLFGCTWVVLAILLLYLFFLFFWRFGGMWCYHINIGIIACAFWVLYCL